MKYIFDLDLGRCIACGACAVACMDQNDISLENGDKPFRSVAAVERPGDPRHEITYLSMGLYALRQRALRHRLPCRLPE